MKTSEELLSFLKKLEMPFDSFEHEAVYTCEEAREKLGHIPGKATKNLFLRDKKGKRYFLVVVPEKKQVDLKALGSVINSTRLSVASPERLMETLGVSPGAVSPLALVNDAEHQVALFLDESLYEAERLQCHPLRNTATIVLSIKHLKDLVAQTGHALQAINVPALS